MTRREAGYVLGAVGLGLAVVSGIADQLGLGGSDGFGWKQAAGVIAGLALAAVAALLLAGRRGTRVNGS